jgi:hypothetical protein
MNQTETVVLPFPPTPTPPAIPNWTKELNWEDKRYEYVTSVRRVTLKLRHYAPGPDGMWLLNLYDRKTGKFLGQEAMFYPRTLAEAQKNALEYVMRRLKKGKGFGHSS